MCVCLVIHCKIFFTLPQEQIFVRSGIQSLSWRVLHSFRRICGQFYMLGCTHGEEPGVWGSRKAIFERNRTRGLGRCGNISHPGGTSSDLLSPSAQWLQQEEPCLRIRRPRVQPQSCFCGSGSVILSPHPLPTLKMGTFKEIGTFKEKPSLRVGRMVSWKQHTGPAGEGSWIRVTEMRPCPPDGLPPHSCLPWDCLAEAASVRAHFALNTNGILFPQD